MPITCSRDPSHSVPQPERGYYRARVRYLYDKIEVVRRSLIFALALSLVGLGPASLSACALLSSKLTECATPKTQSQCDQMHMQECGTKFAAATDTPCCFTSNAPLLESQYKASDLSLTASPETVPDPMGDAPRVQQLPPVLLVQDFSPPQLQSLFCTFLI
jgi:hypothetical protein